MRLEMCVPTLFGLEGLAADELRRLNMDNVRSENGRVLFSGGGKDIARANINLRTGERVPVSYTHLDVYKRQPQRRALP